jgi:hypothetical protein
MGWFTGTDRYFSAGCQQHCETCTTEVRDALISDELHPRCHGCSQVRTRSRCWRAQPRAGHQGSKASSRGRPPRAPGSDPPKVNAFAVPRIASSSCDLSHSFRKTMRADSAYRAGPRHSGTLSG